MFLCYLMNLDNLLSDQSHTPRENLRRHFGLVLRNAEHVDSRSSQEAEDYRSRRGEGGLVETRPGMLFVFMLFDEFR